MFYNTVGLYILLVLSSTCRVFGQNTHRVTLQITNQQKETLPFVHLNIDSQHHQFTDSHGKAIFNLSKGNHILKIKHLGYKEISRKININSNRIVLIQLDIEPNTLQEVELFVNKKEQAKSDGLAVEVINFNKTKYQSKPVNQLLRETTGLAIRERGGLGSRANYSINGLSGRAIRFFLDGIPMESFGSSFSLITIPPTIIEQINIYKGISPYFLGNDALGGSINILTTKTPKTFLTYSYGSFNTHRASFYKKYRNNTSGFTADILSFYNYSDNDYKIWGDAIFITNTQTFEIERDKKVKRFHDAFSSHAIRGQIGYSHTKWAKQMYLGILHSKLDKEIQHGTTMIVPFGEATYKQQNWSTYIDYQSKKIANRWNINLYGMYSSTKRNRNDISKNIYNWYGEIEGTRTLGGEQSYTLRELTEKTWLQRTNLVYHISDRFSLAFNNLFNSLKRQESDAVLGNVNEGYWKPQRFIKNTSSFSFNGKLEETKIKFAVFGKHFSYKANINVPEFVDGDLFFRNTDTAASNWGVGTNFSYKPFDKITITTSVENTTRLPESDEVLGNGLTILHAESLKSETSRNANFGIKFSPFSNSNIHFLSLETTYLFRKVKNLIQTSQEDASYSKHINFEKVDFQGIDFSLQYRFRKIVQLNSGIAYINPIVKSKTNIHMGDNVNYNNRLPNTPFLTHNTTLSITQKSLFQKKSTNTIYWSYYHVGKFYRGPENIGAYNKDIIPQQWNHSLGITHQFPNKKVVLSGDITNVFNAQLFDDFAVQKPGRALFIKMNYEL